MGKLWRKGEAGLGLQAAARNTARHRRQATALTGPPTPTVEYRRYSTFPLGRCIVARDGLQVFNYEPPNVRIMSHRTLVEQFRVARTDPALAVLEGFHPLKHAMRFGAELIEVVCSDLEKLVDLGANFAPDVPLDDLVRVVPLNVFHELAPTSPPTGVIAIARRPAFSLIDLLHDPSPAPVVLLENPRNLLNIGAAVRVSAAAGAAGLVTTGAQDPWSPAALIAATGLHYALPVTRTAAIPPCDRLLVVVDPAGEPLQQIPANAILAFGAEREGLSRDLVASAGRRVSIPMCPGVSSLNLATAVAVVLYKWRFQEQQTITRPSE